jgi:hypothetical protein
MELSADKLLVAVGRQPAIESLQLDRAGVDYDRRGVIVNRRLQSSISAERKKTRPGLPWPGFFTFQWPYAPSCAQRGKADSSSSDQSGTPSG